MQLNNTAPPPPNSLIDDTGVNESDEVKTVENDAHPWRITNVPQPKATHPGTPVSPTEMAKAVPDEEIEAPKTLVEAFARASQAYGEWMRVNSIRDRKLREIARIKAWRKWRKSAKCLFEMQQGTKLIPNSAAQVSVAIALHTTPESQHQKWEIAAKYDPFVMGTLLKAYDESQLDVMLLKSKIVTLELEIQQLQLASTDAAIRWGEGQGFGDASPEEKTECAETESGTDTRPRTAFGKLIGAVFGDAQKDSEATKA